jgi:Cdc6-like AAA superfamily ATPase
MLVLEKNPYIFDQIFYQSDTNELVYEILCKPNVEKLLNGFNSSILCYGQSGSGKTYTIGLGDSKGMIQLTIKQLFQSLEEKFADTEKNFDVSVSFIEIYNEKVYDLLSEKCTNESIYTKGAKYNGSTKVSIKDTANAIETIMKGNKNRHTRSTNINKLSSRSHAVFTINFALTSADTNMEETHSVLHLIDLAGSEGKLHAKCAFFFLLYL